MEKVLGIDLGTNSIGWALREINNGLDNQIIDKGVMTFDKGVAEDKSGEHPMVQKRTESRGKRRNYQAEKYRKWELLQCLIANRMCPLTIEELNEWRYYRKGIGRKYPQSEKFIQWLRFDFDGDGKPDFERLGYSKHESHYLFRVLIVDESKIQIFRNEPHIIGRVLYQLVQRRGYNDGQNIDETEKDELSKTIMKGGGDSGAAGVDNILPFTDKHKTLGSALYHLQKEQNVRIRKRYNLRSHYESEIKELCRVQGIDHLFKNFWSAIIWQRPLRGQKGLVGICTFEKNKRRCAISHPLYEEYRTWVFINNLKIKPIEDALSKTEGEKQQDLKTVLIERVYPQFFKASSDFKLSSIAKELKKVGYEITARFPEDTKVVSFSFLYRMKEIFGDDWVSITGWNDLLNGKSKIQQYSIEDLWHLHFAKTDNKETGETDFEFLKRFALEKLHLDETKAEVFAKIRLQQGYATLSISAIKKILPYLRQGFIYSEAIYLANLHKVLEVDKVTKEMIAHFSDEVRKITKQSSIERKLTQAANELINDQLNSETRFGMDPSYQLDGNDRKDIDQKLTEVFGKYSWQNLGEEGQENATKYVSEKYLAFLRKRMHDKGTFEKNGRLHDRIFNWIKNTYGVPDENIKYLWHPSEQETYMPAIKKDGKEFLGSPEPISKGFKNPMALKTLHKLKKLINYLIAVGKIDNETRVVIEIARELNDANKRKAIERWQRQREKENDTFKKRIDEINAECKADFNREDKNLIDKIRLWEEQNKMCIYTGKTINLSEVLNGARYDIEHSIPASMSFDNELKNLTIADKKYNQQIKEKGLPSECPNYDKEYTHEGVTYPPILKTLQNVFGRMTTIEKRIKGRTVMKQSFKKIEELEEQVYFWVNESKKASTKERKDYCVQQKHLYKFQLDYLRYKLNTFTTIEYKAGWRNSQLRDTQTITKYALPYLKTVFNKVEVQKGNITADFRKILKIQNRLEKKERAKHSHHAIDAAVLTLIPPAAVRDKILSRYNEAQESQQNYHEKPRHWNNFHVQHILSIEDDVLINYQAQHRTLTPTFKTVRKRGKIQYVKEKLANGKWQYNLDNEGKKIPLIGKGDSIRGQLHEESFMGLIKQPEYELKNKKYVPKTDGKGNFLFQKKGNTDELFVVKKIPLIEFDGLKKFEKIIDLNLKAYLTNLISERMNGGSSFQDAIAQPIWAFGKSVDKNGNTIEPLRHVRCRVAKAAGFLSQEKTLDVRKNDFVSKHPHKSDVLAGNDEMVICLFYEKNGVRNFRLISRFELGLLKIKKVIELFDIPGYNRSQKGVKKVEVPLAHIIQTGLKIFLLDKKVSTIQGLQQLDKAELLKRLFIVNNFNVPAGKTIYIYLINHLDARPKEVLQKNEEKDIDTSKYQAKLALTSDKFTCAFEGKHFEVMPDGEVKWI